jgi:hypothetical protein
MSWWIWMILGLILFVGELLTPGGFYLIFFGAAAVLAGFTAWIFPAFPVAGQWLLFSILAIISLLLFRRPLLERMKRGMPTHEVDSLVGETAVALAEIAAGAIGKAEMRGTAWNARNVGGIPIPAGARCRVQRVDGLQLDISAS